MANDLLVLPHCKVEGTSLVFESEATVADWWKIGALLAKIDRINAFLIGEWYHYGRDHGWASDDMLGEIEKKTGLAKQTIEKYGVLASKVAPAQRHSGLSPSHHQEVTSLPPAQQAKLLEQAESHGWTRQELRDKVQGRTVATTPTLSVDELIAKELWPLVSRMRGRKLWEDVVKAADSVATANKRLVFDKE